MVIFSAIGAVIAVFLLSCVTTFRRTTLHLPQGQWRIQIVMADDQPLPTQISSVTMYIWADREEPRYTYSFLNKEGSFELDPTGAITIAIPRDVIYEEVQVRPLWLFSLGFDLGDNPDPLLLIETTIDMTDSLPRFSHAYVRFSELTGDQECTIKLGGRFYHSIYDDPDYTGPRPFETTE